MYKTIWFFWATAGTLQRVGLGILSLKSLYEACQALAAP